MPRPDIARLGIGYRRIPLLGIGRDVYLDTRLQLEKLEALDVSQPPLGSSKGDRKILERLFSRIMIDAGGVFSVAMQLLPPDLPLLKNPAFQKDRQDFTGVTSFPSEEAQRRARPAALREFQTIFDLLETTLLADGRDWVLKTDKPGLADIEAVWPLHWLINVPGALPKERFSAQKYPKVYSWVERFDAAVKDAQKKLGQPKTVSGDEAARQILGSRYGEAEASISSSDDELTAHKLIKGDAVMVHPADMGRSGKDIGTLVGATATEVVYDTKGQDGSVRVHAPRHGFVIRKADSTKL